MRVTPSDNHSDRARRSHALDKGPQMHRKSTKGRSRIYWRNQGGNRRAYADFRDFADVGGKREALICTGTKTAALDPLIAEKLVSERLIELQTRRRNKTVLGLEAQATLAEFAAHHLVEKQRSGRFTVQWLETVQLHLEAAIQFFSNGGRALPRDPITRKADVSGVLPEPDFALWLTAPDNA